MSNHKYTILSSTAQKIKKNVKFSSTVEILQFSECGAEFRQNPNYKSDYAKNRSNDTDGELGNNTYFALCQQKRTETYNNKIYKLQDDAWKLRELIVSKLKSKSLSRLERATLKKDLVDLDELCSNMSGKILTEKNYRCLD